MGEVKENIIAILTQTEFEKKRRRRLIRDVGNDQMVVLVRIHIINKCYFVATTPNNGNDN